MALQITSLNSGSNGNCYYIGNDTDAVLVDAGITCKETEKRMLSLGLTMQKVRAIIVSHEHTDHIRGLAVLASRYNLPVYISQKTLRNSRLVLDPANIFWLDQSGEMRIKGLTVKAFVKKHDAADPHSFTIECEGICVGIFTDIGAACKNLINHFSRCHAAFLEANYDDEMLKNGAYPYYLKKRISGGLGHLSNNQALEVFKKHRSKFMSHLFLSHLSKDNNCPDLVKQLFDRNGAGIKIVVASRYHATP
ncbi:MAG: MBL fold metallo-hydrolase, partial [Panacibacter sp.]